MKVKIDYSIISYGTEKYNKSGYMAVSVPLTDNICRIYDSDHGITQVNSDFRNLQFKNKYEIENVAFSRFELISELVHERIIFDKQKKFLLLGFGSLGITCLINFIKKDIKNFSIYIRKIDQNHINAVNIINNKYKVKIQITDKLNFNYDYFIDTSGSSSLIEKVVLSTKECTSLILLGTPREEKYLINPLLIHRKNLSIIGAHEFSGISKQQREKKFEKLLYVNSKNMIINNFVTIKKYSNKKSERKNFIEVYKYDL